MLRDVICVPFAMLFFLCGTCCSAGTRTWDGRWETSTIDVTMVYFVPQDRRPLPDWEQRLKYYAGRLEQFHEREFNGQSTLRTRIHPTPLISESSTLQLRQGDANAIFFRTLQEADRRLKFGTAERTGFPVLLVLSEINWRPLDDFYRLRPGSTGLEFEGQEIGGQHFPGATSGGARATYLADRGVGWGLVSADGWRVPYRGSDCVVYHEGVGHPIGLPHPEPIDNSVMGVAQYEDWISRSFLNREQKIRLGWEPVDTPQTSQQQLFSTFRVVPNPVIPRPAEPVQLIPDWPEGAEVKRCDVQVQTSLGGPWMTVPVAWDGPRPQSLALGVFERPTPVSFRIRTELSDGASAELMGYFQVREQPDVPLQPDALPLDLLTTGDAEDSDPFAREPAAEPRDLLALLKPDQAWSQGQWTLEEGHLTSPKEYGARMELPATDLQEYRLTLVLEPLDEPNGLIVGNCIDGHRFAALFSYQSGEEQLSALENVDGRNVGNETTFSGRLFRKKQLSQVIVAVNRGRVSMMVDGRRIVDWKGDVSRLSLSDYWSTPNQTTLFLGAYDCRYRFHRITLEVPESR